MSIPSILAKVPEIDKVAHNMGHAAGMTDNERSDLAIALTEIVKNAILHGNQANPQKTVLIHFIIGDDQLTVTVKDEGAGFDPDGIPDPTSPENLLKDTGRGIFVSRHLLDEIRFDREADGMKVTLIKYLDN
ncbi:MAG: ATP-binding protein, partial [Acidobacteria bacterium]|nr:ATP-binding protein [Acidobacteriota bacterium]